MIRLRVGSTDDFATVFPRTRELNAHEGIEIEDVRLAAALHALLADPTLGCVWLIERSCTEIGYAIVTFGFDLEFGGRGAYLTELFIDGRALGSVARATGPLLLRNESPVPTI